MTRSRDHDIEHADPTLVPPVTERPSGAAAEVTRITSSLLKTNEQLANFLVASKADKWKDKEFQSLVSSYLESSNKTLDLFVPLGTCIQRAKQRLLTTWYAVKLFDAESEKKHFEANKWKRLLEDLKGFKIAGGDPFEDWSLKLISLIYEEDQTYIRVLEELKGPTETSELPFDQQFLQMFNSVYHEQTHLLKKLQSHKRQVSKKLKSIKKKRKLSNIIFGIGFFSVPVLTALVMVITVPSSVEVLVGAFSATIASIGKWSSHSWSKRERDVEKQMKEIEHIEVNTFLMVRDLDNLRCYVNKVEIQNELMMHTAEFVMEEEEDAATMIGMHELRRNLISSLETIKEAASSTSLGTSSITSNMNILNEKLQAQHQSSESKARNWLDIFM